MFVFATAVALTAYPPVAALISDGLLGAFRYFAADSFYYLSIAVNSMDADFFTFDGTYPTNGFHPLWMFYLERSFSLFALTDAPQLWFTAISGITFTCLGTGLFALAVLRLTRRPGLTLLATVPGAFYLLTPRFDAYYGSQWSFMNGMETSLSIFFFGLLVQFLSRRDPLGVGSGHARLVVLSVLLSLITLSRLDDIFIFVPFILFLFLSADSKPAALRRIAAIAIFPTLAIGLYLLFNISYAESALPSSGAAKAQPIRAFARNLFALLTTLLPVINTQLGRVNIAWSSEAWRVTQMVVPAVVSLWWLFTYPIRAKRDEEERQSSAETMLGLLAAYVVIKAAYNFTTVGLWNQGHWYYALAIMTTNMIVAVGLGRFLDHRAKTTAASTAVDSWLARWPRLARLPVGSIALTAILLVSANAFVDLKKQPGPKDLNHEFWLEREATQAALERKCPGCGVVSFDDGIVAFALQDIRTLNGLDLVLDAEASRAMQDGRLLEVAWHRGYRVFTSVNYTPRSDSSAEPDDYSRYFPINISVGGQRLDDWRFELVHTTPSSDVSFVRFIPKRGSRR